MGGSKAGRRQDQVRRILADVGLLQHKTAPSLDNLERDVLEMHQSVFLVAPNLSKSGS